MVPFFSPKRRRTTGNLKLASSLARQTSYNDDDGAPPTPGATSPRAGTPGTERPPPTTPTPRSRQRPVSQPVSSPSSTGERQTGICSTHMRDGYVSTVCAIEPDQEERLRHRGMLTSTRASTGRRNPVPVPTHLRQCLHRQRMVVAPPIPLPRNNASGPSTLFL